MNDLMSESFSLAQGTESSSPRVEMSNVLLNTFFEDVETVKEDLQELERLRDKLHASHQRSKTIHSAQEVRELRSSMEADVVAALHKAKFIKIRLEALDRSNAAFQGGVDPGYGPGSATARSRTSMVNGLRKKLKDSLERFNKLRGMIASEYRDTVQRRYFAVTGEKPDEHTLERLISTGESENILQKAIQDQGRGRILDTINEIHERHDAVKDLEKNLLELHQVFLDMSVLVQTQGEQLDDIESNMQRASSFVRGGTEQLHTARKLQKNTRKWTCISIIVLLIIILVIVLGVVKPWK